MSSKVELICSPFNEYEFIYVANDIVLYKVVTFDEISAKTRNEIYLNFPCEHVFSITKYQNQKTVSWYPGPRHDHLIASHELNTSKIRLLSLLPYNTPIESTLSCELNLERSRACRSLQWNSSKSSLASGFESLTNLKSIYIWDIFQQNTKPLYELDESESCYSLTWHPENSDLLFAGSSYSYISIFDLRKDLKPFTSISTEYVYGFTIDPKDTKYAASYSENRLAIWDLRKFQDFKEPLASKEFSNNIKKIQFCSSKTHELAVLQERSTELDLFRVKQYGDEIPVVESINYNRRIHNENTISSFTWFSQDSNQIIFIDNLNNFNTLTISDYVTLNFSNNNHLSMTSNMNKINDYTILTENIMDIEIGEKMRQRALKNYGVQKIFEKNTNETFEKNSSEIFEKNANELFEKNADLISNDNKVEADLKYLWQWLDLSSKLNKGSSDNLDKFNGIKSILSAGNIDKHSCTALLMIGWSLFLGQANKSILFSNFIENNRNFILKLCGWGQWKSLVEQLANEGEYERAACICVFNNDFDKAIEILLAASKKNRLNEYTALSLALNHFKKTNENTNENRDFIQIVNRLTNPYSKLLFAKLIDNELLINFICNETSVLIPDRVAFAILTLNSEQIVSFVNRLTSECIKQGNLYGILLTGFNVECIDLFQSYIHRTNDVQTAAVAIIHSTIQNENKNTWIETYRNLLDQWMLWEQRALFDISQSANLELNQTKSKPKIFVKCNFCGENLSTKSKKTKSSAERHSASGAMKCQNCLKPSLRCCVCSLYMTFEPPRSVIIAPIEKISYAFVFCQICGHGGHLMHLEDWFKTKKECPVMTCNCNCTQPFI